MSFVILTPLNPPHSFAHSEAELLPVNKDQLPPNNQPPPPPGPPPPGLPPHLHGLQPTSLPPGGGPPPPLPLMGGGFPPPPLHHPPPARHEILPPKGPLPPAPFNDWDSEKVKVARKILDDFVSSIKDGSTTTSTSGGIAWPDDWEDMRDGLMAMNTINDDEVYYPPELEVTSYGPPSNLCIAVTGMMDVEYVPRQVERKGLR